MKAPDRDKFIEAVGIELDGHERMGNYEPIPLSDLPKGTKLIDMVWSMRRKRGINTQEVYKWKARLNVHGGQQEHGVHYWDTYAPIVMWHDRIPSTTPGAEPPRDARDSGSARSHSTHLETSSSDRPKWSPTRSSTRYQDQISVTCTRWTLRMPSFTRATHAQPSLSNFTRQDSNFGERTRSRGTTLGERNFPTSPQNKKTKLTHCSIYVPMRTISTSHAK